MGWEKAGAGYWEIGDLSGGKNAKVSTKILDNQATDCLNWHYYNGELRNLFGASDFCGDPVNGSNVAVSGLHHFRLNDGTTHIVATAGDKIKHYETATNTWQDITGSVTVTPGYKFQFATVQNTLVATNLNDSVIKWSGSGNCAALGGTPPKAKLVLPYGDFLLLGNVDVSGTKYPKRIYRSDANDIETWGAANYWSLESENGSDINVMKTLGHRVVVYHDDTISFVSGRSSNTFTILNDALPGVGCVGPFALTAGVIPQPVYDASGMPSGQMVYNYGHIFRSWDGFYIFNGGTPQFISDNIFAENETAINRQLLSNTVMVPFPDRRQIWAFLTRKTELVNKYGYLFDMVHAGWWPHKGFPAECAVTYQENGEWKVLIGGSDGIVRKLDPTVYAISGANMTNYWHSKWFAITKPTEVKMLRDLIFFIDRIGDYDLNVEMEFDLPYSGRKQTGVVDMNPGGATYPGTYGTSKYAGSGIDMVEGNLGGKGFNHVRLKIFVNDAVGAKIEKIGAYIASAGERRVA